MMPTVYLIDRTQSLSAHRDGAPNVEGSDAAQ